MIIKITDIHDNHITMACIRAVRQDNDGMINMIPLHETTTIRVNGTEIMKSAQPIIDSRIIKIMEVIT